MRITAFSWSLLSATWLASAVPAAAQYRFLGELRSFERAPSGVTLRCAPDARLALRFLSPTRVRVTLARPGRDEPSLDHAIARTTWEPVAVRMTEDRGLRAAPREVTLDERGLGPSSGEDVEGWTYDAASRVAMVRIREAGAIQKVRVR